MMANVHKLPRKAQENRRGNAAAIPSRRAISMHARKKAKNAETEGNLARGAVLLSHLLERGSQCP